MGRGAVALGAALVWPPRENWQTNTFAGFIYFLPRNPLREVIKSSQIKFKNHAAFALLFDVGETLDGNLTKSILANEFFILKK
jgi:hypothetical protein